MKAKGFTLLEVLLAIALIGLAALTFGVTFPTLLVARLRSDMNREAVVWHHNYCLGLAKGDFDRGAFAGAPSVQTTFTLPSNISITVTDTFSAPVGAMPSALFIESTATWSLPNNATTGSSVITVARGTQDTTL